MTEDEMVQWDHQLNVHEFEQAPGGNEGQGSLVCYSLWDCKVLDTTEWLSSNNVTEPISGILFYELYGVIFGLPW